MAADHRKTVDKTVLKSLGLSGGIYGAVPCAVDVKDGKVVRIRPLHFDDKYDPATFNAWKMEKNGKTFEPLLKAAPSPWSLAYKKRTYSPNRIKYPLKRVDWDPEGERQPAEPGQEQVRAHLLGRGDRSGRRRDQAHPQRVRTAGHPGAG